MSVQLETVRLKPARQASRRNQERLGKSLVYLALIVLGLVFVFPLLWMILTSLKTNDQIYGRVWLPHPFVWQNFPEAVKYIHFALYAANTVFICVVDVLEIGRAHV